MAGGANSVHMQLREEMLHYIKTQYLGKSPFLFRALEQKLQEPGVLYQEAFIESSPAYQSLENGMAKANIPQWMREFFLALGRANLGVYPNPFCHQIEALELSQAGQDLFVSTGTGSGKTECFLWPLLAKLTNEAREQPESWSRRGVRTVVLYPMNALVSDQVSRLRRLIGDSEDGFLRAFHEATDIDARRPQFGMYTGRTPYPGETANQSADRKLASMLKKLLPSPDNSYYEALKTGGKIPAKKDLAQFVADLRNGKHITNPEDAELVTRFEMQKTAPDILITNYSMLEYMLLRPREQHIWTETKAWLQENPANKLLFIIDEAHMYRGSAGGEVSLLIRRLFHKLGIPRDRVQFILTTASMPNKTEEDIKSVHQFAMALTSAETDQFAYLVGQKEQRAGAGQRELEAERFLQCDMIALEEGDKETALSEFWDGIVSFLSFDQCVSWMYDHLLDYKPFYQLFQACRGNAISLKELASHIFPELATEEALHSLGVMLAIAPMAKNREGQILFPVRMHMLFRGIHGIYACTNQQCSHGHTDGELSLGQLFLWNGNAVCPHCGSIVRELYNDRRCGALFFHGYVSKRGRQQGKTYFWSYPGEFGKEDIVDINLYIPPKGFKVFQKGGMHKILPCYLDTMSGFLYFDDDSMVGKPNVRKLYYGERQEKGKPSVLSFYSCPHCEKDLGKSEFTSFSTRGNQSFYNLVKAQFFAQPPVRGKENNLERMPNQGRKVLLFSDSRQRAAKLARDMSELSDDTAVRQIFGCALAYVAKDYPQMSLDGLYGFLAKNMADSHAHLFEGNGGKEMRKAGIKFQKELQRSIDKGRTLECTYFDSAPLKVQAALLQMYCGRYNTLLDSGISWLVPTENMIDTAMEELEERDIVVTEEEFLEIFYAWSLGVLDERMALGPQIGESVREKVRRNLGGYGLKEDWTFPPAMAKTMGWKKNTAEVADWRKVLSDNFLEQKNAKGRYFLKLRCIRPMFDMEHTWHRCKRCAEITPYTLKGHCPNCGFPEVEPMEQKDFEALEYWRQPIIEALAGEPICTIDTEEHTAQLSQRDQRESLWAPTELYELRFQDILNQEADGEAETPVDILSCTTTMEVGIDIGSLVAVGLRNIPPMRENYQQRAGRAGRRGASLSTIVTFCEDGPHDTLYFQNPIPMLRGLPRRPWIDKSSEKLIERHFNIMVLRDFLETYGQSLDDLSALSFYERYQDELLSYLQTLDPKTFHTVLAEEQVKKISLYGQQLRQNLDVLREKCQQHPELYKGLQQKKDKSMLDALYEEGIIPAYSFPKNVVTAYIEDNAGKKSYQVQRGLDVAIGEYAPGRSIVVDKKTYQIGGIYTPHVYGKQPAKGFLEDPNYKKGVHQCEKCGWFGLTAEQEQQCPFCGNPKLSLMRPMVRPWGFAPVDGCDIVEAQLEEVYSSTGQPLYSTLANGEAMVPIGANLRSATLPNQRLILLNNGPMDKGFLVCEDCGATVAGDDFSALQKLDAPYRFGDQKVKCRHNNVQSINLGYDFLTDMLVLEIRLDNQKICGDIQDNLWLSKGAQTVAEALRLRASYQLDVEFTELVTGYRLRQVEEDTYVDVYLYDNLCSGAGYASSIQEQLPNILQDCIQFLESCSCDSGCYHCLKHYRNQYAHGQLDRLAALDLLRWGIEGQIAKPLTIDQQEALLRPLYSILLEDDILLQRQDSTWTITKHGKRQNVVVYPAMWVTPKKNSGCYISAYALKYAKPRALEEIVQALGK